MMRTIVYAPGCWDILHSGHRNLLRRSKAIAGPGGILIVGVVSDDGAALYKRRPVQSEAERLGNVADLRYVDRAVLQPTTDPTPVLEALLAQGYKPAILTHGDDWAELREGNETLQRLGIRLVTLPYGQGSGTTGIIDRIRSEPLAIGGPRAS